MDAINNTMFKKSNHFHKLEQRVMVKLVLTLAVVSLMVICLPVCSPKSIAFQREDEKAENSGSGIGSGSGSGIKEDTMDPNNDDEDYSGESGLGSDNKKTIPPNTNRVTIFPQVLTQEEAWRIFISILERSGIKLDINKILKYSQ